MIDINQWRAAIGSWNCCCCRIRVPVTSRCRSTTASPNVSTAAGVKWPIVSWLPLVAIGGGILLCISLVFLHLLLSGDVELNPGPTTVEQVCKQLKESLRVHYADLQKATRYCISSIATELFAEGLISGPVRDLSSTDRGYDSIMNELSAGLELKTNVSQLEEHCQLLLRCFSTQGGPTNDVTETIAKEWTAIFISSKSNVFPVASLSVPKVSATLTAVRNNTAKPSTETVQFESKEEERRIETSLGKLHKSFSHLMRAVKNSLRDRVETKPKLVIEIAEWVETHMNWEPGTLSNADLNDVLKKIYPYCDFIDCSLIQDMSEEFLNDVTIDGKQLLVLLNEHIETATALRSSTSIREFKSELDKIIPRCQKDLEKMPTIIIKLHNPWKNVTVNGLSLLIQQLLPIKLRQSLTEHITIETGSVHIRYTVRDCTADSLIAHVQGKLQFMRLIGIFSLAINDQPILRADENVNFTFELALLEAASMGNIGAVQFLFHLNIPVNYQSKNGSTALMAASHNGHHQVVELLLEEQADPNLQRHDGVTALMLASQASHPVVELLLKKHADPNIQDINYWTALMVASQNGCFEAVQLLLKEQGVDPNTQNQEGATALMIACQYGHYYIAEILLIEEQTDPNIQNQSGVTALMLASRNGHTLVTELLLRSQANPNIQNQKGLTALMLASQNGNYQVVELLLKEQADPNIQRQDGVTALMLSSENGHNEIVELLLKEQADPNIQHQDGVTALMLASENGHYQIVNMLINDQANPNFQDIYCWTALMLASQNGHRQTVELLLKRKADPKFKNHEGTTALMLACQIGHYQIVKMLLKEQADPNIQRNDGVTALILASQNGHYQVVESLLKEQADPNIQRQDGVTALMAASQNGHHQVVELLLKEQADPNIKSNNGAKALFKAGYNGHYEVVELLLREKTDVADMWKALLVTSQNGHCDIVELLLKAYRDCGVQ